MGRKTKKKKSPRAHTRTHTHARVRQEPRAAGRARRAWTPRGGPEAPPAPRPSRRTRGPRGRRAAGGGRLPPAPRPPPGRMSAVTPGSPSRSGVRAAGAPPAASGGARGAAPQQVVPGPRPAPRGDPAAAREGRAGPGGRRGARAGRPRSRGGRRPGVAGATWGAALVARADPPAPASPRSRRGRVGSAWGLAPGPWPRRKFWTVFPAAWAWWRSRGAGTRSLRLEPVARGKAAQHPRGNSVRLKE